MRSLSQAAIKVQWILGLGPAPLVLGTPSGYGTVMASGVDHREITGFQYLVLFSGGGPHPEVLSGSVPLLALCSVLMLGRAGAQLRIHCL